MQFDLGLNFFSQYLSIINSFSNTTTTVEIVILLLKVTSKRFKWIFLMDQSEIEIRMVILEHLPLTF
jgi:hypothetical protein